MFTYSVAGTSPVDGFFFIIMQMIGGVLSLFSWRNSEYVCSDFPH
jgi:hypothetical protein